MKNNRLIDFTAILILGLMLLLPSISAFEFDNVVSTKVSTATDLVAKEYPAIEISNSFLGIPTSKLAELQLEKHDKYCGIDCMSEFQINTYEDSALIDDIRFYKVDKDGNKLSETNIENEILILENPKEVEVTDYKDVCFMETIWNGSKNEVCRKEVSGTHLETVYQKVEYKIGEKLQAGKYLLQLNGKKNPEDNIDWIITSHGREINEWAMWFVVSDTKSYYSFDSDVGTTVVDTMVKVNATNTAAVSGTGISGADYVFNGVGGDRRIVLNSELYNGTSGITTISVWVKPENVTNTNGGGFLFQKDNSYVDGAANAYLCGFMNNRTIECLTYNANVKQSVTSTTNLTLGIWTNVIFTFGTGGQQLYINGILERNISTNTQQSGFGASRTNLAFGAGYRRTAGAWQSQINGSLDEIGIWERALNQTEIEQVSGFALGAASVNISYPSGLVNYATNNSILNLNYSIVNAFGCILNYNNVNTTIPCLSNTTFNVVSGIKNLTIYVLNHTHTGTYINATTSWDYKVFENGLVYNTTSTLSAIESFVSNVTTNSIGITSAYLNYNGLAPKLMTLTNVAGYEYRTNTTRVMIANGTYSFYITYNLADGNQINSTTYYQTVSPMIPITVSATCGAGLTPAINFTSYWEANLSAVNMSSVTYNLQYGLSGNSTGTIANGTLTSIGTFSICINNSAPTYNVGYGEIQYSVDGAVDRRYYIFSGTRLINTTVAIPIYALETSKATSFLVTAETTALQTYKGYYVGLLRWYPASTSYRVVDMGKTDDNGQTVLRVKTEDVDYRLGLYQSDGTLIKLLSPIRMICQTSPCTYSLFADATTTDLTLWNNIQRSLTFDEITKVFTFTWNDPSQVSQTINLTVYKDTGTSSDVVCTTSASGYTGILTCNVSAYSGNLRAEVFRKASPSTAMASLRVEIKQLFSSIGGGAIGLFLGIVLLIFFALIGTFSPVIVVILGMISLIPLWLMGNINIAVMTGIGVIGGVVLHFMRRVS